MSRTFLLILRAHLGTNLEVKKNILSYPSIYMKPAMNDILILKVYKLLKLVEFVTFEVSTPGTRKYLQLREKLMKPTFDY